MRILDPSMLSRCQMDRVICHWSEGNHRANDTDLRAYHILIEGDGNIRFGVFRIDDNVSTADGRYAAHTLNCNTRSIGVSCCSMVGCQESPFQPGSQPMNQDAVGSNDQSRSRPMRLLPYPRHTYDRPGSW